MLLEFEDDRKKPTSPLAKIATLVKVSSILKPVQSLRKVISFYDIEANFHGDKQMLYDPDVKFSKFGDPFWRLDFKPSSLKRWAVYRNNIKFMAGLGVEAVLVAGVGLLFLYPVDIKHQNPLS